MLGLGFWELVILGLIALIVIGPERLPDFAKGVARFLNEMRRTASDLKRTFDDEKDIFKENIDQLQKLKKDIQAFPELDDENHIKNNPYQLDQAASESLQSKADIPEQQLDLLDPYEPEHMPTDHLHHEDHLAEELYEDLESNSDSNKDKKSNIVAGAELDNNISVSNKVKD